MKLPMIIFVIVYMAVLVSYLFSETSGNFKRRAVNKIILASMFLLYSIFETIHLGLFNTIQIICLIGVIFAYIGDVWLLWSFIKGGTAFSIGNVVLFGYLIVYLTQNGVSYLSVSWHLILLAILLGCFIFLVQKGWYDKMPDKMKWPFTGYILSVSLHGTLAFALLTQLHDVKSVLLCSGLVLFMISDYFISLHKFKYKESKLILRCNSFSYFTGLMLVALSFSF